MAKLPRLGNLNPYVPRWWHQAEPNAVALENFQPRPEPSSKERDKLRFEKLADIALHRPQRKKRDKQAA